MKPLPFRMPCVLSCAPRMPAPVHPLQWAADNHEEFVAVLSHNIECGAAAVCAPTMYANPARLEAHRAEEDYHRINCALMAVAVEGAMERVPAGAALGATELCQAPDGEATIEDMIAAYRRQIRVLAECGAAFLVAQDMTSLTELRAALIAAQESSSLPVIAQLRVDDEGVTPYGTELLAAAVTAQSMGAAAIGIYARGCFSALGQILRDTAPYLSVPVMAVVPPEADEAELRALPGVSIFAGIKSKQTPALLELLERLGGFEALPALDRHVDGTLILAADSRSAHFIDAEVDITTDIECTPDLDEEILAAEDDSWGAMRLHIDNEDDLAAFMEHQYLIRRPLCLCSDDPELFERAVRAFDGRAIYDGTCELTERHVAQMAAAYGLIRL